MMMRKLAEEEEDDVEMIEQETWTSSESFIQNLRQPHILGSG
jgi:hypothetical protein